MRVGRAVPLVVGPDRRTAVAEDHADAVVGRAWSSSFRATVPRRGSGDAWARKGPRRRACAREQFALPLRDPGSLPPSGMSDASSAGRQLVHDEVGRSRRPRRAGRPRHRRRSRPARASSRTSPPSRRARSSRQRVPASTSIGVSRRPITPSRREEDPHRPPSFPATFSKVIQVENALSRFRAVRRHGGRAAGP